MRSHFDILRTTCALALAGTVPAAALAADLLVPGNGSNVAPNYNTIQAAVNAAVDGDVVRITTAGTYNEAVTISNKNIRLTGDVPNVIIGQTVTTDGSSSVSLMNFTRQGGSGDGIAHASGGPMSIQNVTVDGASVRGIFHGSGTPMVILNTISRNNAFDGYTCNSNGASVTIDNSEFTGNGRAGFLLEGAVGTAITANVSNSIFRDNPDNNVGLIRTMTGSFTNCEFESTNPNNFVQFRFDNTENPAEAIVALSGCTFTGPTQNGAVWLIHRAILTVQDTVFEDCFRGVGVDSFGRGSTINIWGSTFNGCDFAALSVAQQANVTVGDSTFDNNRFAIGFGGDQSGASGVASFNVSNSEVTNTSNSAIIFTGNTLLQANVSLTNVTIRDGRSPVFGSSGSDGAPASVLTADRCTFIDGTDGASDLFSVFATNLTLRNSILDGGYRQIVTNGSTGWAKLTNCTLVSGDGFTEYGFLAQTTNAGNAVVNSILDGQQIGLAGPLGVTTLANRNNIMRATTNFERITPGSNNLLNVDPLFIQASSGPGTGNLRLQAGSPAIDAGDASVNLTVDRDNYPRGTAIDIGAYELHVNAARSWMMY